MYRRYRQPNLWREMDQLQREMKRLFEMYSPVGTRTAPSYPAVNIWSNEDGLLITAEVPGVKAEDIDINVVGQILTLNGERKPEKLEEGAQYHRQERGYGKFSRVVELPYPINVGKVEAIFKNGVLTITLPRAEEDKPKKIKVKGA